MKTSNIIMILICLNFTALFGQTNTTLVRSLALQDQKFISFNLTEQVELEHWDKDFIRIEISITADNVSEKILKQLIKVGRYEIMVERQKFEMSLHMPNLKHIIMVAGENLEESISFKVMLPKGMISKINNTPSLASISP